MTIEKLKEKAVEVRKGALDMIFKAGAGHIGGTLSSADVITALFYEVMKYEPGNPHFPDRDRFVLSKGHCIEGYYYVLADQGFFEKEELNTFCRYGTRLIGHPSREVPGIEMNTGALGHGLSCGCGMAVAGKMDKKDYRVFVLMGDGELNEGSIWEAAMFAANQRLDNLYAILDRNHLQISGDTEDIMQLEPLKAKWKDFGFYVREVDGNDMKELLEAFAELDDIKEQPKLLLMHTVKGKGISFMENSIPWHHAVPNQDQYEQASEELNMSGEGGSVMGEYACRKALCETLVSLGKKNRSIVALTSDARGSACLNEFVKELPEQFVEVGIAEQNEVGVAAGLASCGKIPFVCSPAPFLCARSLEQVKVDVGYSGMNVKLMGVSGGFAYGALGSSHHALHDLAVMRALNGLTVVMPADAVYTRWLVKELARQQGGVYVRMGRAPVPDVYEKETVFQLGRANCIHEGRDITVIACGAAVFYALEAAKYFERKGITVRVLDMHTVKPVDRDAIIRAARETGKIITVEEHSIYGGLGGAVAEITAGHYPVPVKILGIPDEHIYAGTEKELYGYYGIDTEGIIKAVREALG